MNYRTLGKTGLKVSEIAFGSEALENRDTAAVDQLLNTAIDLGINFFDLYNPNPAARAALGRAIRGRREEMVIQGHLCTAWQDGQYVRTRDLIDCQVSYQDLLARLDTSYIDIGMIHYVDTKEDFHRVFDGPVIAYTKQLKEEGVIRHIGLSSHNPEVALMAVRTGLIEVLMFSVNPAYDMLPAAENIETLRDEDSYRVIDGNIHPDRDALYQECERRGVAITVMKAFAGGALFDAKQSPFEIALMPAHCLHYALTRPGVAAVMTGAMNAEQLIEAARYCEASEEEKDFGSLLHGAPVHAFAGKCMYCGHCAPCTAGIDIAAVHKYFDLCQAQGEIPETIREHYEVLAHHAGECIGCGACEQNCPFGVPIIEKMAAAKAFFGK